MSNVLCGQQRNTLLARFAVHAEIRLWERTTLTKQAIQELLASRKYVPLRILPEYRRAVVIYSEPDDSSYVVLQNYRSKEVITILPLAYWKFDDLTENSAQAWQARYLVLEAEKELFEGMEPEELETLATLRPVCAPSPENAVHVERYIETSSKHMRVRDALAQKVAETALPDTGALESQAALAVELAGETAEPGNTPACHLVLKVLRQDPYVPVKFKHTMLRRDFSEMLGDSTFAAAILKKMASLRVLDEDILGVHLRVGSNNHELSAAERDIFFKACVDCIGSLAQQAGATASEVSEKVVDVPHSAADTLVTAVTEDQTVISEPVAVPKTVQLATVELIEDETSVDVDDTLQLPESMSAAAPLPDARPIAKPLSEFEQLMQESGWAVRRPAVTSRAFRAC